MGSVRASPQAVLIEAVGLTQWRRRCRRADDAAAQRRLRVRGGQRHVVADARRGAPGGSRGERRTASPVRPRAASSSAATRAACGRWPTCSAPASAAPCLSPRHSVACTACTRGGGIHVRPGSSATATPRSWPGAGCAAALADARWQAASATLPSRCDRARLVTVNLKTMRDKLDARRRARQRASRGRGPAPTLPTMTPPATYPEAAP